MKKKIIHKSIKLLGILLLMVFLNGCIMPSYTHSKGIVSIQVNQNKLQSTDENASERFIVVSFWEYPIVNESQGKVIINKVILVKNKQFTVDFPRAGYWIVWTPALGTQHLAPEPGIMVFHKNLPLSWNVGGTYSEHRVCCEKPKIEHTFEFTNLQETMLQNQENAFETKRLFKEFLSEKKNLVKKMGQCKGLTAEEKMMVLQKLDQIEKKLCVL